MKVDLGAVTLCLSVLCVKLTTEARKNTRHVVALTTARDSFSDPKYVFIFPEENKKLVLTKSDFQNAVYPNVTNINKFPKKKKKESEKDSQHSSSALTEAFRKFATVDDYDNIVEENVRTERTFVNFMNDLNADLKSEEKKFKGKSKKVKSEHNGGDWDSLGLEGWSGQLAPQDKGIDNHKG